MNSELADADTHPRQRRLDESAESRKQPVALRGESGAPGAPGAESGENSTESDARSDRTLRWWGELLLVCVFYGVYSLIRNQFGSDLGESVKQSAIDNAYDVIALERALHLFGEKGIQDLFIEWEMFIRFWNIFYGFCHFAVTIAVMVFLYLRHPARYGVQRTVLAVTTALALIGFAFYPLMPPRLLGDCGQFGACDQTYSYVDTLAEIGGFWSFNSSAMTELSNQYAAMPSLHIAWSLWCVVAALPVLRRRWARLALLSYPWLTLFAVMVTANHYWIDAVGGLMALLIAYPVGVALSKRLPSWLAPPARPESSPAAAHTDTRTDTTADTRADQA
ncbi:MAG: phosphatase PAP2 family protein [Acidimicrobiaceae bacterium]|nr:phosphatase PAP2 family protein [Acidimicrobiaceae bacterium]MCY4280640.1 phosphatase PAP2 family protein [Acidimicrobiaceae bacterium]